MMSVAEKRRAYMKKWRAANSEKCNARLKKWQTDNPEKVRAAARRRYAAHPEKTRNNELKRRYKISLDDYNKLALAQNGLCRICGQEKKLVVDHDHKTEKYRGLLCRNCNTGLGQFKDNPAALLSAVAYLSSLVSN